MTNHKGAKVICQYCGLAAALVTGKEIYPHREDLHDKRFYQCKPCDAYVGVHGSTVIPLGILANSELRAAKMQAHAKFDPLWKSGAMKRNAAYQMLADKLGIEPRHCHIGMFNVAMCKKVIEVLK